MKEAVVAGNFAGRLRAGGSSWKKGVISEEVEGAASSIALGAQLERATGRGDSGVERPPAAFSPLPGHNDFIDGDRDVLPLCPAKSKAPQEWHERFVGGDEVLLSAPARGREMSCRSDQKQVSVGRGGRRSGGAQPRGNFAGVRVCDCGGATGDCNDHAEGRSRVIHEFGDVSFTSAPWVAIRRAFEILETPALTARDSAGVIGGGTEPSIAA